MQVSFSLTAELRNFLTSQPYKGHLGKRASNDIQASLGSGSVAHTWAGAITVLNKDECAAEA